MQETNINEHRRPVDKQTNRSKPTTVSEHFLCNNHDNATDMQLIRPFNLIVTVYGKQEKHTSVKEVRRLSL